jgi:Glutathione-dependent formaldehyde-activating enzyme
MSSQITTDNDVVRQTIRRMAISTGISLAMTATMLLMSLGSNPDALMRVGDVMLISLCAATIIPAVISGILSHRSARLMKELTLTRSEFCAECGTHVVTRPNRPIVVIKVGTLDEPAQIMPQVAIYTTGFSRSLRANCLGAPLVYLKPSGAIATNMLGEPPVMYWHSRQWHCACISGWPSAS